MEPALETLDRVAARLETAQSILFITGAGISAPSGIPTYRGIGGLYNDTTTDAGVPIEQALSGETFARDPALTWRYVHQIERASRGATFNRAHEVVALMEARFSRVRVLTQNVDGLHRAAGSRHVIDIHGDIRDLSCTGCGLRMRVDDYSAVAALPRCDSCRAVIRPEVVLFGERLPIDKVEQMYRELAEGFDAIFSIGTTSVFPYIMQPVIDARRSGKLTVEINPARTTLSDDVDFRIDLDAAEAMEGLWRRVEHQS